MREKGGIHKDILIVISILSIIMSIIVIIIVDIIMVSIVIIIVIISSITIITINMHEKGAIRKDLSHAKAGLESPEAQPHIGIYHVMWFLSFVFLIGWLYLNERMSNNTHLIGTQSTIATSHDRCQSPIVQMCKHVIYIYIYIHRQTYTYITM